MKICGLKFTHDGGVAVIEDNTLLFSVEMEKLGNNPRHQVLTSLDVVEEALKGEGISWQDIDRFAADGWGDLNNTVDKPFTMWLSYKGNNEQIELASYGHIINRQDLLQAHDFGCSKIDFSYKSYMHVSGHVFGAFCSSPFIKRKEDSFVLVWDGGMSPQLFYIRYRDQKIENLRPLFNLNGNCYAAFAQQYAPFNTTHKYDLSVAGKVMAYIALGKQNPSIQAAFNGIYNGIKQTQNTTLFLIRSLVEWGEANNVDPRDMITNFHYFLSDLLVRALEEKLALYPGYTRNLCFAGGCALNIKWNSAIRNSGIISNMWVPPFPNDSGSAIGVACCEMVRRQGLVPLEWNVYCGPIFKGGNDTPSWKQMACPLDKLASLIHSTNEPVLFLNGRAEIGPRALGNRSILASPVSPAMKSMLNTIKKREAYRPVAPICIEEDAAHFFDPGTPDPYMLYDHIIRPEWLEAIPAVAHLDDTARLQTVGRDDNPMIYELLQEFKKISGLPVLCNTSANLSGSGFFPDLNSAIQWGKTNFIWHDGCLYYKAEYGVFLRNEEPNNLKDAISREPIIIKL